MSRSKSKPHKIFTMREDRNYACQNTIEACYNQFMFLNDVALSHLNCDLRDVEKLQNMLYEVAMEAACVINDVSYDIDHDIRLLRMRQITDKF